MATDLGQVVEDALTAAQGERPSSVRIAIAYSGGADSTALLHAAGALQRSGLVEVFAFHIHPGLASHADAGLEHCRAQAASFGVAFDAEHVVPTRHGVSLEADARRLRYAALTALCHRHRCTVLMTAHHQDDQAETVLVNLARGTGVGGLAAAARSRMLDDVLLLRPLIDVPVSALRDHVAVHALEHVVDPSNADRRYTRNAMRHEVMPALRRIAPTIAARLSQTASHASAMQSLLDEIGREDIAGGAAETIGDELDVEALQSLSPARAANALRVWLVHRGMRAPSTATLREMLDQLLHASAEAQIELLHEKRAVRLYRGRISIDSGLRPRAGFHAFAWTGEPTIDVPQWHGSLSFVASEGRGFDAVSLKVGALSLRERRGGERMRLHADGPSRTLKNLYQEAGVPAWQRVRLPLLYLDDRLIHAAGIGTDASALREPIDGAPTIVVEWHPKPFDSVHP